MYGVRIRSVNYVQVDSEVPVVFVESRQNNRVEMKVACPQRCAIENEAAESGSP